MLLNDEIDVNDYPHCEGCGLLSPRDKKTHEAVPASRFWRGTEWPFYELPKGLAHVPVCFVGAAHLWEDAIQHRIYWARQEGESVDRIQALKELGNEDDAWQLVQNVISAPRDCKSFIKVNPGLTPHEHIRMEIDQKLQDEERNWRERQDQRTEEFHNESLKVVRETHKREMLIVGVAVTVIFALMTLLGAAIEGDWIPKWFGLG